MACMCVKIILKNKRKEMDGDDLIHASNSCHIIYFQIKSTKIHKIQIAQGLQIKTKKVLCYKIKKYMSQ